MKNNGKQARLLLPPGVTGCDVIRGYMRTLAKDNMEFTILMEPIPAMENEATIAEISTVHDDPEDKNIMIRLGSIGSGFKLILECNPVYNCDPEKNILDVYRSKDMKKLQITAEEFLEFEEFDVDNGILRHYFSQFKNQAFNWYLQTRRLPKKWKKLLGEQVLKVK